MLLLEDSLEDLFVLRLWMGVWSSNLYRCIRPLTHNMLLFSEVALPVWTETVGS